MRCKRASPRATRQRGRRRRRTGPAIVALYDQLLRVMPSPIIELNRAVAVSMVVGPQAGLDLVDVAVAGASDEGIPPGACGAG